MKNYFLRSFRYNAWANQQTLASLRRCPAAQAESVAILSHMLAAENVWISRLTNKQPALAVWPSLNFDDCEKLAQDSEKVWLDYLENLNDDDWTRSVEYRTSRGDPYSDSVADILTHVTIHGGYHRGQLAKIVVRNGGTPAVTDFIVYVRSTNAGGA